MDMEPWWGRRFACPPASGRRIACPTLLSQAWRPALLWNLLPTGSYKLRVVGRRRLGVFLLTVLSLPGVLFTDRRQEGLRHVGQLGSFFGAERFHEMRRHHHQQLIGGFLCAAAAEDL